MRGEGVGPRYVFCFVPSFLAKYLFDLSFFDVCPFLFLRVLSLYFTLSACSLPPSQPPP